jgi:hypothetical protein
MHDVALVTCRSIPEPDVDAEPLLDELARRGVRAAWCAWDDPAIDFGAYRLAVVRSTWNYYLAPSDFARWIDEVSQKTRLENPARVLRWNMDKAYLGELAEMGLRTVPTVYVEQGGTADLPAIMDARGWSRVVMKPRVSAGSFETYVCTRQEATSEVLTRHASLRPMMVQPYMASVESYGERSMVFLGGALSHAVRKSPRFAGGEESTHAVAIAEEEAHFAEAVVSAVCRRHGVNGLLYGRVDLARDDHGAPCIMELELCEPSLFLKTKAGALAQFANAIQARLR